MTNDDLKKFFDQRPALSKAKVAEEAGLARRTLEYKLSDDPRPISDEQEAKLLPVMRKYGYSVK